MVGQFKAPMSQERLTSRLFSDFVEDSILTRFVPGYDIGVQLQGRLADGIFNYQAAIVNGRSHLDNQGRSRNDDNDTKEGVGRITIAPFATQKDSPLKGLRFGGSGSSRTSRASRSRAPESRPSTSRRPSSASLCSIPMPDFSTAAARASARKPPMRPARSRSAASTCCAMTRWTTAPSTPTCRPRRGTPR